MSVEYVAYAWRSGRIQIGRCLPDGALPLLRGSRHKLRSLIRGTATLAYDNKTHLVPGMGLAANENEAYEVFIRYHDRLQDAWKRRANHGGRS